MATELTDPRVVIGKVTFNQEAGPAPRARRKPFILDLLGSLFLVLFFVGAFLAFKVCLETLLPLIAHEIAEQVKAVRGY